MFRRPLMSSSEMCRLVVKCDFAEIEPSHREETCRRFTIESKIQCLFMALPLCLWIAMAFLIHLVLWSVLCHPIPVDDVVLPYRMICDGGLVLLFICGFHTYPCKSWRIFWFHFFFVLTYPDSLVPGCLSHIDFITLLHNAPYLLDAPTHWGEFWGDC